MVDHLHSAADGRQRSVLCATSLEKPLEITESVSLVFARQPPSNSHPSASVLAACRQNSPILLSDKRSLINTNRCLLFLLLTCFSSTQGWRLSPWKGALLQAAGLLLKWWTCTPKRHSLKAYFIGSLYMCSASLACHRLSSVLRSCAEPACSPYRRGGFIARQENNHVFCDAPEGKGTESVT